MLLSTHLQHLQDRTLTMDKHLHMKGKEMMERRSEKEGEKEVREVESALPFLSVTMGINWMPTPGLSLAGEGSIWSQGF